MLRPDMNDKSFAGHASPNQNGGGSPEQKIAVKRMKRTKHVHQH
jgi:hypothetical protein